MANMLIDEVLPKLEAAKNAIDEGRGLSATEVADIKSALERAASEPLPSPNEIAGSRSNCAICLVCGFWNPIALPLMVAVVT